MKTSNLSFAQSRTKAINGTVKTQSGEAFAFANISVSNSSSGTAVDQDGNFALYERVL